ncbi:MAG: substrate-binding domain-containing protein [Crocinitomicaceae bacterium]|mgnify:FL=1|nr:substrate-binding domain-containing protein [Crocinitomicaceae bacterium]
MLGLKVGGVPEHFNYPWRIAIEEGLFRNEGIALHWADMSGGTGQMIKGLQSGSIDVAIVLTEGISRSILQGLDAKILEVYVSTPLCWGVHVPFKSRFKSIKDLESQTIAISREASGSHLMSYVMADQNQLKPENMKFNVVGDVYGGLWALENREAQVFLWEKFTTQPYVDQRKCRRIGEVYTPWPSFVIAARKEVIENHPQELKKVIEVIQKRSKRVKESDNTAEIISWRYNLDLHQVRSWLSQTEWNEKQQDMSTIIEKVVTYLSELELLSTSEKEDWSKKLFI